MQNGQSSKNGKSNVYESDMSGKQNTGRQTEKTNGTGETDLVRMVSQQKIRKQGQIVKKL